MRLRGHHAGAADEAANEDSDSSFICVPAGHTRKALWTSLVLKTCTQKPSELSKRKFLRQYSATASLKVDRFCPQKGDAQGIVEASLLFLYSKLF